MTVHAYASDQLVLIAGNLARMIEEKWKRVWTACKR